MFLTAITVSAINLVVYGTLLNRIHPKALLLASGYSLWIDLVFTGLIAGMAVATGSLTALIISSVTGLYISGALYTIKWYVGSAKFIRIKDVNTGKKKFAIVEYAPTGGPNCFNTIKKSITSISSTIKSRLSPFA